MQIATQASSRTALRAAMRPATRRACCSRRGTYYRLRNQEGNGRAETSDAGRVAGGPVVEESGSSMKALQLVEIGQPLEARDVGLPPVGAADVLVSIRAAGICHSDAHYRTGTSPAGPLPLTLGHEIAGEVVEVGSDVAGLQRGDRVCLHYLVTCGACRYCLQGQEQFCTSGRMIGKHRDGGYAEAIVVPARGVVPLPDEISYEHGAVLMCSSATSFHALRKSRFAPGETVAVFGLGGLGMSAVQLAQALGALDVYGVDINGPKLRSAAAYGAIPVDATKRDPVRAIRRLTGGRGVDVALELVGLPETMQQAVGSLAVLGRAVLAGITDKPFLVDSYRRVIGREAEIIGCSDHLLQELPLILELSRRHALDLENVVAETAPLDTRRVNAVLDALETFEAPARTVIVPRH